MRHGGPGFIHARVSAVPLAASRLSTAAVATLRLPTVARAAALRLVRRVPSIAAPRGGALFGLEGAPDVHARRAVAPRVGPPGGGKTLDAGSRA